MGLADAIATLREVPSKFGRCLQYGMRPIAGASCVQPANRDRESARCPSGAVLCASVDTCMAHILNSDCRTGRPGVRSSIYWRRSGYQPAQLARISNYIIEGATEKYNADVRTLVPAKSHFSTSNLSERPEYTKKCISESCSSCMKAKSSNRRRTPRRWRSHPPPAARRCGGLAVRAWGVHQLRACAGCCRASSAHER